MADFHAGVFDLHVRHYSGRREIPEIHGGTHRDTQPGLADWMAGAGVHNSESHAIAPHACTIQNHMQLHTMHAQFRITCNCTPCI